MVLTISAILLGAVFGTDSGEKKLKQEGKRNPKTKRGERTVGRMVRTITMVSDRFRGYLRGWPNSWVTTVGGVYCKTLRRCQRYSLICPQLSLKYNWPDS